MESSTPRRLRVAASTAGAAAIIGDVPTQLDHLLDDLLDDADVSGLAERTLDELRAVRDRLNEVELGLSYGRRMAQGRLDIVSCEIERRAGQTSVPDDLLGRLPEVLARHTRGSGLPRPVRDDAELPAFADEIVADLDRLVLPTELSGVTELADDRLAEITSALGTAEATLSAKRQEAHRLIDEVQEEIVGRYRSGAASVDDLLT